MKPVECEKLELAEMRVAVARKLVDELSDYPRTDNYRVLTDDEQIWVVDNTDLEWHADKIVAKILDGNYDRYRGKDPGILGEALGDVFGECPAEFVYRDCPLSKLFDLPAHYHEIETIVSIIDIELLGEEEFIEPMEKRKAETADA